MARIKADGLGSCHATIGVLKLRMEVLAAIDREKCLALSLETIPG